MRRLAALLLACLLTGCGGEDDKAAFVDSRIPPSLSPRFHPPEGWAWGLISTAENAPVQRYGVSAPAGVPSRGDVLILPDYGESAEVWFETARDINQAGWTVWVLDRLAQGGSARYAGPRDLGHAVSLQPDVAATRAMAAMIIRPARSLIVIGQGEGGMVAQAAAPGAGFSGLILSSPIAGGPAETGWESVLRRLGLGRLRTPGADGWRRDGRLASSDAVRSSMLRAWQTANPDLRMGGPSLARAEAARRLSRAAGRTSAATPVLILQTGAIEECAPPSCRGKVLAGGSRFHLESDRHRRVWLTEILDTLALRVASDEQDQDTTSRPHRLTP